MITNLSNKNEIGSDKNAICWQSNTWQKMYLIHLNNNDEYYMNNNYQNGDILLAY